MVMKARENLVGAWAYLIGVVLAIIIGIFQTIFQVNLGEQISWMYALLAILGIIVGLMNVGGKDTSTFLIAAVSLVLVSFAGASTLQLSGNIGAIISVILTALLTMFVPATIIVAIKAVFDIAS